MIGSLNQIRSRIITDEGAVRLPVNFYIFFPSDVLVVDVINLDCIFFRLHVRICLANELHCYIRLLFMFVAPKMAPCDSVPAAYNASDNISCDGAIHVCTHQVRPRLERR